jgi:hypothetical protein
MYRALLSEKGGADTLDKYPQCTKIENEKQSLVNMGHLAKLYLDDVRCPCGELLLTEGSKVDTQSESAMCAACGTWTCSQACHEKHMMEPNLCTFHHNFSRNLYSMASLANFSRCAASACLSFVTCRRKVLPEELQSAKRAGR